MSSELFPHCEKRDDRLDQRTADGEPLVRHASENVHVTTGHSKEVIDFSRETRSRIAPEGRVIFHPEVPSELPALPIEFHPATRALADMAADFKARYKLSLADAFAAALAKERKAELVTGDPEFKNLQKEIKLVWLK